ncbi:hypothetical protein DVA67_020785 [Solirubrobacter sp. CPCC 204708]|uniref:NlpC/P60 domain-containing protein n=1 Tax=Solirubrobacter deserti TaxID=2282478 RepID=A0ABT4RTD2_9ACTN|nr:hypothetical protein [Solirubrobacter deserti]MBE2318430.1 hypothetical protein [Solirubrobacter deserti]MDA0141796.1 hypothetical protein [Solirubrobacter deserti]
MLPVAAAAQAPAPDKSGGAVYQAPTPVPTPPPAPADMVVPGAVAQLLPDGSAAAPADAPPQVQQAIFAANRIQNKPYIYGGGHAKVEDKGYDCSGTVSYALLAHADLGLEAPLPSGNFMSWGEPGEGQWITVYANPGHAYAVIAGLRLDTSIGSSPRGADRKLAAQHKKAMEKGPRWRPWKRPSRGYTKRHPVGF